MRFTVNCLVMGGKAGWFILLVHCIISKIDSPCGDELIALLSVPSYILVENLEELKVDVWTFPCKKMDILLFI